MSRIAELEDLVRRAKDAYYNSGTPILSDAEYDAIEEELLALAPDSPALAVGAPVYGTRARHSRPMGSQDKVHSRAEFEKWFSLRGSPDCGFVASLKCDGGSVAAYYKNGALVQAITRGDGIEGQDITPVALKFKGLPSRVSVPFDGSIRFEAVLLVEDWQAIDPESNPRNLANGILGRKDTEFAGRITAMAFDVEGLDVGTERQKSESLTKMGFSLPEHAYCKTVADVASFFQRVEASRASLPFWIDGVVVKMDDLAVQEALGAASNCPKGQVAWKFQAEEATSVVEAIEWQVGHSGAITPVASLRPVNLGGTIVSRASLANVNVAATLGVCVGAEVRVVRAGDVIPQILAVTRHVPGGELDIPRTCPCCGGPVTRKKNSVTKKNESITLSAVIYCEDPACPAKVTGRIRRWAKSRDILGLGDSLIEALHENGLVTSVASLFDLTPDILAPLALGEAGITFGRKRAESVCAEIRQKSSEMTLAEFLGAFGTRGLGVRRAGLMIAANPELADFERWLDGSLADPAFAERSGVPSLGSVIFEDLKESEDDIRAVHARIVLRATEPAAPVGKTLCITGKLPSGRQKSFYAEPLARIGITLVDDVTKGLDFLVVSDPSAETSKSKKAKKFGCRIISEDELVALCDRGSE